MLTVNSVLVGFICVCVCVCVCVRVCVCEIDQNSIIVFVCTDQTASKYFVHFLHLLGLHQKLNPTPIGQSQQTKKGSSKHLTVVTHVHSVRPAFAVSSCNSQGVISFHQSTLICALLLTLTWHCSTTKFWDLSS